MCSCFITFTPRGHRKEVAMNITEAIEFVKSPPVNP
jgi:hypothetical protein